MQMFLNSILLLGIIIAQTPLTSAQNSSNELDCSLYDFRTQCGQCGSCQIYDDNVSGWVWNKAIYNYTAVTVTVQVDSTLNHTRTIGSSRNPSQDAQTSAFISSFSANNPGNYQFVTDTIINHPVFGTMLWPTGYLSFSQYTLETFHDIRTSAVLNASASILQPACSSHQLSTMNITFSLIQSIPPQESGWLTQPSADYPLVTWFNQIPQSLYPPGVANCSGFMMGVPSTMAVLTAVTSFTTVYATASPALTTASNTGQQPAVQTSVIGGALPSTVEPGTQRVSRLSSISGATGARSSVESGNQRTSLSMSTTASGPIQSLSSVAASASTLPIGSSLGSASNSINVSTMLPGIITIGSSIYTENTAVSSGYFVLIPSSATLWIDGPPLTLNGTIISAGPSQIVQALIPATSTTNALAGSSTPQVLGGASETPSGYLLPSGSSSGLTSSTTATGSNQTSAALRASLPYTASKVLLYLFCISFSVAFR